MPSGGVEHANRVLVDWVDANPEKARSAFARLQEYTVGHGAVFGGKPIPYPLKPVFLSRAQAMRIRQSVETLLGALESFTHVFLEDERLQAMWDVSEEELGLYRIDPGYAPAIQVARFDGLLRGDDLRYLEFNCDSPGGNGDAQVIQDGFVRFLREAGLDQDVGLVPPQPTLRIEETVRAAYNTWRSHGRQDRPADPFVVVSDWKDIENRADIDINVARLGAAGFDVAFVDPRELTFDGERLRHGDRAVDVVYKRVIVKELLENPAAEAITDAYRAGAVCLLNPPRSVLVGNKKILHALRLRSVQEALTPAQRAAVDAYVPWSVILSDLRVMRDGQRVGLRDYTLANQSRLVLKASRSYGGKDVLIGFDTDEETWAATVDDHLKDGQWIVQELVPIPRETYPMMADGGFVRTELNVNINPVAFAGRYAGSYCRVSPEPVINVSAGGGMVPCLLVEGE